MAQSILFRIPMVPLPAPLQLEGLDHSPLEDALEDRQQTLHVMVVLVVVVDVGNLDVEDRQQTLSS